MLYDYVTFMDLFVLFGVYIACKLLIYSVFYLWKYFGDKGKQTVTTKEENIMMKNIRFLELGKNDLLVIQGDVSSALREKVATVVTALREAGFENKVLFIDEMPDVELTVVKQKS